MFFTVIVAMLHLSATTLVPFWHHVKRRRKALEEFVYKHCEIHLAMLLTFPVVGSTKEWRGADQRSKPWEL